MEHEENVGSLPCVELYDTQYAGFRAELYAGMRREIYDEDFGQASWLTGSEFAQFREWLCLRKGHKLLDVACGAGGPTLELAKRTGCEVHGIDIHAQGIANANALAEAAGLADRARFQQADARGALPFQSNWFDAVLCIDAINHLSNRAGVLGEWGRVLRSSGRLVFTDPTVITGSISNAEMKTRSSIGFFLFVPPGENERLLQAAGFRILATQNLTDGLADNAGRFVIARKKREAALREVEGDAVYEGQNQFYLMTENLAREHRLSRFAFLAEKVE